MNPHSAKILSELNTNKNPDKAKWLENYVKHDIKSIGVGIPKIREIIKNYEKEFQLSKQPNVTQIEFLDDLMKNEFTESKLAAILFIQLYWKTNNPDELLALISRWFDNEWITDWNVCDWLCVRLLSPVLDKNSEMAIAEFTTWHKSPNLWKARASLVPFAQCKTMNDYPETILKFSEELIKREERFCKTAVGWVLRQYSKIDRPFVEQFLEKYADFLTKEVIRNATKYFEK
jgi:3-methyladenine DNA glycosylase AlkD